MMLLGINWLLPSVGMLPSSAHITDNFIMVMVKKMVNVKARRSMDGTKGAEAMKEASLVERNVWRSIAHSLP